MMEKNLLIAFYSYSSNTRRIAELIKQRTGGTLWEIVPLEPYPAGYNAVVEQAKREISSSFQPPLKTALKNADMYSALLVGSPNWWSTIAPPVATFLGQLELSGKAVMPFCTHGGGGEGNIGRDIAALCPHSQMAQLLSIYGGGPEAERQIAEWLQKAGL